MKYGAYLRDVDVHRFAPSRGRELKYLDDYNATIDQVRPLTGAGIEIYQCHCAGCLLLFAPSRGRELK